MTSGRAPRRDEDPLLRKVRRRLLAEVQPVHDRVAELGDITRRLKTRQSRLKGRVEDAARRLTAASRERAALKTSVEELRADQDDVQRRLEEVAGGGADLDGAVAELREAHDKLLEEFEREREARKALESRIQEALATAGSKERLEAVGNPSDDSDALRRSMARAKLAKPDLTPAGRVRLVEQALELGALTPDEAEEYRAEHHLPPRP